MMSSRQPAAVPARNPLRRLRVLSGPRPPRAKAGWLTPILCPPPLPSPSPDSSLYSSHKSLQIQALSSTPTTRTTPSIRAGASSPTSSGWFTTRRSSALALQCRRRPKPCARSSATAALTTTSCVRFVAFKLPAAPSKVPLVLVGVCRAVTTPLGRRLALSTTMCDATCAVADKRFSSLSLPPSLPRFRSAAQRAAAPAEHRDDSAAGHDPLVAARLPRPRPVVHGPPSRSLLRLGRPSCRLFLSLFARPPRHRRRLVVLRSIDRPHRRVVVLRLIDRYHN
jgi:hypothetical protein